MTRKILQGVFAELESVNSLKFEQEQGFSFFSEKKAHAKNFRRSTRDHIGVTIVWYNESKLKDYIGVSYEGSFGRAYGYWMPIPEKPEWIIHFSVGRTVDYEGIER